MNWKTQLIHRFYACNRFVRFVIEHVVQDDCTYIASALAFTSLLAVVPLMSVGLAVFSSFPVFQGMADPLQNFIFENFVPSTGKVVQVYLQQFTAQVSKLSIWGAVFLIVDTNEQRPAVINPAVTGIPPVNTEIDSAKEARVKPKATFCHPSSPFQ